MQYFDKHTLWRRTLEQPLLLGRAITKYSRLLWLGCALGLVSGNAHAWDNVTILTTNDSPAVNQFVMQLKGELNQDKGIKVNLSKIDSGLSINIPKDTLLVAVGTQALAYASNLGESTPILGALVPKTNYESILAESKRSPSRFSAVYLDQPFTRQLSLIKVLFPNNTSIGTLLGAVSQFQSNDLQDAAKKFNMTVNIRLINKESELQSSLEALMQDKQILLAIPDPLIYTKETAQTILLTSYRHQSPVIGFSQSYAKSGAIAAVFTSPKQFASEISNIIEQLPSDKVTLPSARAPAQFSIQINRQVAKSLNIVIPKDEIIYQQMLRDEK
ncbi:MAG TPA: ABC transporter substrate binding protein [Methylophilus sp.]